jgi:hypothetical protein
MEGTKCLSEDRQIAYRFLSILLGFTGRAREPRGLHVNPGRKKIGGGKSCGQYSVSQRKGKKEWGLSAKRASLDKSLKICKLNLFFHSNMPPSLVPLPCLADRNLRATWPWGYRENVR